MTSKVLFDNRTLKIMDRGSSRTKQILQRAVKIGKVSVLHIENIVNHMIGLCNLLGERDQVFIRVKKAERNPLLS